MKIIRFKTLNCDKEKIGVLSKDENSIFYLEDILKIKKYNSIQEVIENLSETEIKKINDFILNDKLDDINFLNKNEVIILSPIKKTVHDIICTGFNYADHLKEVKKSSEDSKRNTSYFLKRASFIIGPNDYIDPHFDINDSLDYEVELAVIIGKKGYKIKKEKAEDYIFGYTIINDISSRNLQTKYRQWNIGKSLDSFTSMGPAIIHRSSMPMPFNLDIESYLNGELRQHSNTRNMIIDIPSMIEEISEGITLEPGDIIATGTCSGVGVGFNPPKYMQSKDTIECKIENIGILKNFIK